MKYNELHSRCETAFLAAHRHYNVSIVRHLNELINLNADSVRFFAIPSERPEATSRYCLGGHPASRLVAVVHHVALLDLQR